MRTVFTFRPIAIVFQFVSNVSILFQMFQLFQTPVRRRLIFSTRGKKGGERKGGRKKEKNVYGKVDSPIK